MAVGNELDGHLEDPDVKVELRVSNGRRGAQRKFGTEHSPLGTCGIAASMEGMYFRT